jgi:hypothetical protein
MISARDFQFAEIATSGMVSFAGHAESMRLRTNELLPYTHTCLRIIFCIKFCIYACIAEPLGLSRTRRVPDESFGSVQAHDYSIVQSTILAHHI